MRISPSTPPLANPFTETSPLRPVFELLVSRNPIPPIVAGSGPWNPGIAETLRNAQKQNAAPTTVIAALHLMNDDLDAAHVLVQNDGSQTGSYLHYLVHRREGDWSNTRYWAARTGTHPLFKQLAQTFGAGSWDARTLVGEMEEAAKSPQASADYQAAATRSAREITEAVVWCANAEAVK